MSFIKVPDPRKTDGYTEIVGPSLAIFIVIAVILVAATDGPKIHQRNDTTMKISQSITNCMDGVAVDRLLRAGYTDGRMKVLMNEMHRVSKWECTGLINANLGDDVYPSPKSAYFMTDEAHRHGVCLAIIGLDEQEFCQLVLTKNGARVAELIGAILGKTGDSNEVGHVENK